MSDLMDKIHEFAEEARQWDIEHGRQLERDRIIKLLELEASEWLSHDGECDCKLKGEEGVRLISRIRDSK